MNSVGRIIQFFWISLGTKQSEATVSPMSNHMTSLFGSQATGQRDGFPDYEGGPSLSADAELLVQWQKELFLWATCRLTPAGTQHHQFYQEFVDCDTSPMHWVLSCRNQGLLTLGFDWILALYQLQRWAEIYARWSGSDGDHTVPAAENDGGGLY